MDSNLIEQLQFFHKKIKETTKCIKKKQERYSIFFLLVGLIPTIILTLLIPVIGINTIPKFLLYFLTITVWLFLSAKSLVYMEQYCLRNSNLPKNREELKEFLNYGKNKEEFCEYLNQIISKEPSSSLYAKIETFKAALESDSGLSNSFIDLMTLLNNERAILESKKVLFSPIVNNLAHGSSKNSKYAL